MSEERKKTIQAYGAELVLTPGAETDVDLVLEEVARIKEQYPGQVFEIGQFYREDNLQAHINNTGPEIWEQTGGDLDAFIMCQGTGGTVTGTAKYLKVCGPILKYSSLNRRIRLYWLRENRTSHRAGHCRRPNSDILICSMWME